MIANNRLKTVRAQRLIMACTNSIVRFCRLAVPFVINPSGWRSRLQSPRSIDVGVTALELGFEFHFEPRKIDKVPAATESIDRRATSWRACYLARQIWPLTKCSRQNANALQHSRIENLARLFSKVKQVT